MNGPKPKPSAKKRNKGKASFRRGAQKANKTQKAKKGEGTDRAAASSEDRDGPPTPAKAGFYTKFVHRFEQLSSVGQAKNKSKRVRGLLPVVSKPVRPMGAIPLRTSLSAPGLNLVENTEVHTAILWTPGFRILKGIFVMSPWMCF